MGSRRRNLLVWGAAVGMGLPAAVAFYLWVAGSAAPPLTIRRPEPDETAAGTIRPIRMDEGFQAFEGTPSSLTNSWPQFRGPRRDNVCHAKIALADRWGRNGPPVLWSVGMLGDGYAGPAVANGRVYVLDYDVEHKADTLRCFSLEDGRELWRRWYRVVIKRNHGYSRTVPAVNERFVVTLGPKGQVLCADAITGAFRWGIDLRSAYGIEVPLWYAGECPLLDGDTVILGVGGSALMIAVDCATGRVLWETPNPDGWKMSHASVTPMRLRGRRMYVYPAIGGLVGVAADGPDRGRVLWKTTAWNHAVIAPSPVFVPDHRVLVTAGYGGGSMLFDIARSNGVFYANLEKNWSKETFACEQQTPIYYRGCLLTLMPKDAGALRGEAVCMRPDGTLVWHSGKSGRFGLGPFLVADDKLFILNDDGRLTLAGAGPEGGFHVFDSKRVLHGQEAWAPMAIAGTRLLCRDARRLVCLDVGKKGP